MDVENTSSRINTYFTLGRHGTAYTLRACALAFRGIAPFGRSVVYAGTVRGHSRPKKIRKT